MSRDCRHISVTVHPIPLTTGVAVLPGDVQATATDRLEVEARAHKSATADAAARAAELARIGGVAESPLGALALEALEPLPVKVREQALEKVDEGLVSVGLLSAVGGAVSPDAVEELSWERESCLPTAGVIVKGCLDECDVCEPEAHKATELDLEHKQLENDLLKKQIALLEKS